MSQSISLTVQIDDPCQENWNIMETTQQGRFCNKCQKQVIDFTDFTDQQMLNYFLANPFPVCGRLRSSQRDHTFAAAAPKLNRKVSPVAAALLTLTAITTETSAHNVPHSVTIQQQQPPLYKPVSRTLTDSVTISGMVKDANGVPIENAAIVFGDIKLLSDKNGHFQFTLPTAITKPAVIKFSYGKLEPEARSYHPVMGSTSYDIVLFKGHMPTYVIMGGITSSFHLNLPEPISTLTFHSSGKLDKSSKDFLATVAAFMKSNPELHLSLKSYYKTSLKKAINVSKLVKDYLVDSEGISEERLLLPHPEPLKHITPEVIIELRQAKSVE